MRDKSIDYKKDVILVCTSVVECKKNSIRPEIKGGTEFLESDLFLIRL